MTNMRLKNIKIGHVVVVGDFLSLTESKNAFFHAKSVSGSSSRKPVVRKKS